MARNNVKAITRSSFDTATLTNMNFQAMNTGLENNCFYLEIYNNSNRDVDISFDGTNPHIFLKASEIWKIESQTNSSPAIWHCVWKRGQIIYAKAAAGTGTIYISGLFCN